MLGWVLLAIVLIAVFGLGTVLEVAIEALLVVLLLVAILAVGGYLLMRSRAGDTTR